MAGCAQAPVEAEVGVSGCLPQSLWRLRSVSGGCWVGVIFLIVYGDRDPRGTSHLLIHMSCWSANSEILLSLSPPELRFWYTPSGPPF